MQDDIVERLGCFLYVFLSLPLLALLSLAQWWRYGDELHYYASMRLAMEVGLGALCLGIAFFAWGLVKSLTTPRSSRLCSLAGGLAVVHWLVSFGDAYGLHAWH